LNTTSTLPLVAFEYGQSCSLVDKRLSDATIETRQAYIEASTQGVLAICKMQVDFGLNRKLQQGNLSLASRNPDRASKQPDQPGAKSCSGLVPAPGEPGKESLMSRRPSELRATPCSRSDAHWAGGRQKL
jgi:hypothetical protein